jgi:GDP-L-fucose synthase
MRVMVTGGAGFLGWHLVRRLQGAGLRPVVVRRSECDLTVQAEAARLFAQVKPELVFHLAAEVGGIEANRANPGRYWYANLAMGLNVLEASRLADVHKLVTVGTICSYPSRTPVPFREQDLWNGFPEETNAPYGVAKRALITGAKAYRTQYGLNTVCLLPVNLYGPGDNFDPDSSHVIPALIRKMAEAAACGAPEVVLWGDGTPTREFLFVEDCAEALWLAAVRHNSSEPLNIGSGRELTIGQLAAMIAKLVGFGGGIVWDTGRPNGQLRRRLDVSAARAKLGFESRVDLEEGLRRTVDWYMARRAGRDAVREAPIAASAATGARA